MKMLLILRHAKSSWKFSGVSDHDRPLKKRGMRDAPRMGWLLREEDLLPDLILSSTATRARKTAELVAEKSGYEGELEYRSDFYGAGPEDYINALCSLTNEYTRVMVVGHNPGLEELLELLTGEAERLPTAALAQVALPIHTWRELSDIEESSLDGKLVNLWRPRDLGEASFG